MSKLCRLKIFFCGFVALLMALGSVAFATDNPKVLLKTSKGEIVLELYPEKAPKTVANFLKYVGDGQYNGTIFHRVIKDFMIQGGGFNKDLREKSTRGSIPNESGKSLKNDPYTVAMARTNEPNSATAQFFINVSQNNFLDYVSSSNPGYAVFGKVIKGEKVVDEIKRVKVHDVGVLENVPEEPVIIELTKIL